MRVTARSRLVKNTETNSKLSSVANCDRYKYNVCNSIDNMVHNNIYRYNIIEIV